MARADAPEFDKLLTTGKFGEMFGVSSWTVRQWIANGVDIENRNEPYHLKPTKLQGRYRIPMSQAKELANLLFGERT